ncbi:MAG: hypothetical protein ACQEXJ_05795 [Myxococcota bacterium]
MDDPEQLSPTERISHLLETAEEGSPRHRALTAALDFKGSWIELAGHLEEIARERLWKDWDHASLDTYCRSELQLTKSEPAACATKSRASSPRRTKDSVRLPRAAPVTDEEERVRSWIGWTLAATLALVACDGSSTSAVGDAVATPQADVADAADSSEADVTPQPDVVDAQDGGEPDATPPADVADAQDGDEPDAAEPAGEPMSTCAGSDDCAGTSQCVGHTCPESPDAVGRCTDPTRDVCGCGAVWDGCETAGTTCLAAGCDYPGLCVTPEEMRTICESGDAGCFECPWCDGELCIEAPEPECWEGASGLHVFTQEWTGCAPDGSCRFSASSVHCALGEACADAACGSFEEACDAPPAEAVGAWKRTGVVADLPDLGPTPVTAAHCLMLGFDQALEPLNLEETGLLHGMLVTDYPDTWTGCLVAAGDAFRMDVKTCQVTCYGHDEQPGLLGTLTVGDGELVVRRKGRVYRAWTGEPACDDVPEEGYQDVDLTLTYAPAP